MTTSDGDKGLLSHFFTELAGRPSKENDLSDVTCSVARAASARRRTWHGSGAAGGLAFARPPPLTAGVSPPPGNRRTGTRSDPEPQQGVRTHEHEEASPRRWGASRTFLPGGAPGAAGGREAAGSRALRIESFFRRSEPIELPKRNGGQGGS